MRRARGAVLALWLGFLIACALVIGRAEFTADLSAFLPRAPTPEQQLLVDQLREGALSRLILIGIGGADAAARARLSRALAAQLRADAQFAAVSNGEAALAKERELIFAHRYLLSPTVTPQRFSVEGLREAIAASIELLASPAGMLLKSVLARDPTGELTQLLDRFEANARPDTADGVWVSKDRARALLLAQTKAGGSDIDAQQRAIAAIERAFASARAEANAAAARLVMTGTGVFSVAARETIKNEAVRLSALSAAIIVALLLAIYRSAAALALGLLPVLSGIAAGVAAVSLRFGIVHGITLGFGTTLIGEAVDYAIYLFVQSRREAGQDGGGQHSAAPGWVAAFWPTIRLGVVTSVCGFAALLFSGFPGLAQLGLYSIAGLLTAAAVTRWVLPQLLPARLRIRDVEGIGGAVRRAAALAPRLRWPLAALVVAACVLLYAQRGNVWQADLAALSPIPAQAQALDATLRADLGAPDARYLVVVPAADAQAALAAAERVGARLDALVAAGAIAGYESPARYLPSIDTQRARQASLPPADELRLRLPRALDGLPLRAQRLEPFIADIAAARAAPLLARRDLEGTSLAAALDALLVEGRGRWNALLPLRAPAAGASAFTIDPGAVRAALRESGEPGALLVDLKSESDRLYRGYLREAIALSLAGAGAIVVVLLASLRSARRVARVCAPLLAAVAVVAAAHVLAGRQLTILHLIGMLLIVAVGSNYALFFDRAAAGSDTARAAQRRTLASLLFANLTTVAGFGVLAFSTVPVLNAIGSTVGPGAVLALVFAAVLARREAAG